MTTSDKDRMMDSRDCTGDSASVRDAAATWFTRVQAQSLSADEQAEFQAWRTRHASHEAEYQWLASLWSATDLLPKARLQALCELPDRAPKRRSVMAWGLAASDCKKSCWVVSACSRALRRADLACSSVSLALSA